MTDPDVARFPVTGDLILLPARGEHCPRAVIQQAGDHLVRRSPT